MASWCHSPAMVDEAGVQGQKKYLRCRWSEGCPGPEQGRSYVHLGRRLSRKEKIH